MKNKRVLPLVLAMAFMLLSVFTVFAEVPKGTVIIGDKAYDLNYANSKDKAIRVEIRQELVKGLPVYVKIFSGQWIDNVTRKILRPDEVVTLIPKLTYKDKDGKVTTYEKGDGKADGSSIDLEYLEVTDIN